ncbi:MAG: hypothetical protein V9G19_25715 [Tetrasphaera sp.]
MTVGRATAVSVESLADAESLDLLDAPPAGGRVEAGRLGGGVEFVAGGEVGGRVVVDGLVVVDDGGRVVVVAAGGAGGDIPGVAPAPNASPIALPGAGFSVAPP